MLAIVVGSTTLAACMVYQRAPGTTQDVVVRKPGLVRVSLSKPGSVSVNLPAGQTLVLFSPFIVGDSLGGYRYRYVGREDSIRTAVALADVTSVEVQRFSATRTLWFFTALGASALLIAVIAGGSHASTPAGSGSGGGDKGGSGQSCPFVYAWDGAGWRLASGTFGGAIARPLTRTVVDNLDSVVPQSGVVRLKVTNELDETDHLDALAVLAVDHAPGVTVAADPAGNLHTIGALEPPVTATDFRGADALARVRDADGWNWESSFAGRDTVRVADLRDGLQLAFVRPPGARRAHLVVDASNTPWAVHLLYEFIRAHGAGTDAWYDSLNAEPALAQAVALRLAGEGFLAASVRTQTGWAPAGLVWEVGPELARRQVLELDLSAVVGDTVLVRLESAPALWLVDRVAMDFTADGPLTVHELPLVAARDRAGNDVARLIAAVDGLDYVMEPGDTAEVSFRAPALGAGMGRTFLLRSSGWYRIHVPSAGTPDVAMLDAVMHQPLGVSRTSVAGLNAALARLAPPGDGERRR
ncbi:MAG: hypothetical protein ABSG61_06420 [Gemmatimonadales bacterium]